MRGVETPAGVLHTASAIGRMRLKSLVTRVETTGGADLRALGLAWNDGTTDIAGVELRVDAAPFRPTELETTRHRFGFRRFAHRWPEPPPGPHELVSRARDASGLQPTGAEGVALPGHALGEQRPGRPAPAPLTGCGESPSRADAARSAAGEGPPSPRKTAERIAPAIRAAIRWKRPASARTMGFLISSRTDSHAGRLSTGCQDRAEAGISGLRPARGSRLRRRRGAGRRNGSPTPPAIPEWGSTIGPGAATRGVPAYFMPEIMGFRGRAPRPRRRRRSRPVPGPGLGAPMRSSRTRGAGLRFAPAPEQPPRLDAFGTGDRRRRPRQRRRPRPLPRRLRRGRSLPEHRRRVHPGRRSPRPGLVRLGHLLRLRRRRVARPLRDPLPRLRPGLHLPRPRRPAGLLRPRRTSRASPTSSTGTPAAASSR